MAAIVIAFVVAVVVGIALYFTNVICSWGIGNKCSSPAPVQQPSAGTGCAGRFYKECVTDNECQTGQKCEQITINFSQVMMCT